MTGRFNTSNYDNWFDEDDLIDSFEKSDYDDWQKFQYDRLNDEQKELIQKYKKEIKILIEKKRDLESKVNLINNDIREFNNKLTKINDDYKK